LNFVPDNPQIKTARRENGTRFSFFSCTLSVALMRPINRGEQNMLEARRCGKQSLLLAPGTGIFKNAFCGVSLSIYSA
jgi:hypothetical protein